MSEEGGATEPSGTEEARVPNLLTRIGQVFFSPGQLFDALKQRPVWLDALLVVIALYVVMGLLMPESVIVELMQLQSGQQELTPEQMAIPIAIWRYTQWLGVIFSVLVTAGFLILVYNVLLGGEARFRQLFSAACHAMILAAAGGIITAFLSRRSGEFETLGLNLLIPGLSEGFLSRFLQGMGVFSIWVAIVLGIAVSRIYPKRSPVVATGLLLVITAVFAALFAMFSGGNG